MQKIERPHQKPVYITVTLIPFQNSVLWPTSEQSEEDGENSLPQELRGVCLKDNPEEKLFRDYFHTFQTKIRR